MFQPPRFVRKRSPRRAPTPKHALAHDPARVEASESLTRAQEAHAHNPATPAHPRPRTREASVRFYGSTPYPV